MLRLFRQPGVRVAQQRIQLRRFTNLSGDQGGLSGLGEKREASRNAESEAKQHWAPNNNDRLWDHVNKLDDRVAGLSKGLGDFKGDVNKTLGELVMRMEAGFGRIETNMAKSHGDLKADIKPLIWQVRSLLGGRHWYV
ncbi:uncharacterized protein LAJ45_05032 [Morchella importuna]|uniref:uncharacterized protein n=1 Tax=Morchella importuna TaxID=1174673 RepID=UPI001E8D17DB|nr:uncharacterized protein LAJ45_05032 [Morchella importuna]KAH8150851.1 hypothetical protein LAJ45_05032 [Morchella importuna]